MDKEKNVYALIAKVAAEMAKTGISKNQKNASQGYAFRGIDDVYNTLAPVLSSVGLVVLPRVLAREVTERAGARGNAIFSVAVEVEFDFVSAHDQSKHTVKTFGEAMDSGDKATNKAMSAAFKYAMFQTFCIPTEGDNDADASTHEVKHVQPSFKERDTSPLSRDQINDILKLADEIGLTIEHVEEALGGRLEDVQAHNYERIMRSLEKKRKAK